MHGTTDDAEPDSCPPSAVPTACEPETQRRYEPEPAGGPHRIRGLSHPHELTLRGTPVMCSACGARRDWLLINRGRDVWVRCRCGHQWLEPEIRRADYDALIAVPEDVAYPTTEQAMLALGFDGSFAGVYLP